MKGAAPHADLEFADEWSYTQAMNLRLSKQWHTSNRVYMADSHFMGVDDVECLLLKVQSILMLLLPYISFSPYLLFSTGEAARDGGREDAHEAISNRGAEGRDGHAQR